MSVIVLGSVHGSPGATSLALDLAALDHDSTLVIEADPDGGRLAARLDLPVRPGLIELAGSARSSIHVDDLWRFAQGHVGTAAVVVAHPAAEQVGAALRAAVHHIAEAIREVTSASGRHVVVDIGRIRPGSPAVALMAVADHVVVVADNTTESAVALAHRAQLLRFVSNPLVVLNRRRPYSDREIEIACGHRVWGVVPHASGDHGRSARRRMRAVRALREQLFATRSEPAASDAEVMT